MIMGQPPRYKGISDDIVTSIKREVSPSPQLRSFRSDGVVTCIARLDETENAGAVPTQVNTRTSYVIKPHQTRGRSRKQSTT